jgi:hypothetical protein
MVAHDAEEDRPRRWQRRADRREAERRRIRKHGAAFARAYADALRKRLRGAGGRRRDAS